MKFQLWLWVVIFAYTLPLFAQETTLSPSSLPTTEKTSTNLAFKAGEWLKFRIHYGIFNASYATIELREAEWNGRPAFYAKGIGRTTGLARLFFKVDDYYSSYFTKDDNRPLHFIRNINEGGYKKHLKIDFDHLKKQATVIDIKKEKTGIYNTDPDIQDLISFVYYLRKQLDVNAIKKDEFVVVNLFFDSENYAFKFKFVGIETIKTKFGKVKTLKFRPYVQSGRVFRSSESITLWVSSDDNKIPLRLQADLSVGSIIADLDAFKGLINPFEIVVEE
ncbi:MAG: ATP-dependent exonuclease [Flavobacteriaceae bacterium]|jgi:hypothetical protein|nr:ATP-dependent exonuclease [Flavobacteriaceae bacterium]MBJ33736.1 ATP-dependent exonuclease [Flavobacteriaceae bacterium]|tara:strand:- start:433 stop:1263 length:831 start_codon:yes stop_codon:yes gene_type:complete